MSGQWEVVGKKKERSKKVPTEGNATNKNPKKPVNVLNGVKLEEVFPKSQVHSLYNNAGKNKEKNDKENNKVKPQETKKQEHKAAKPQEPPKPKPPKSIESALNLINDEEFCSLYERTKTSYPTSPVVWLKDLTQFLNAKVPVEIHDPVFSSKHADYPFSVVPAKIKSTIEKSIQDAGKSHAQLYFDIALTSMVTDLSKGLPATGYRFYLQHIARTEPKLVVANISKHVTLRNSYQNRPNVALAILWAVGQVGLADQQSGLEVFEELMLPLIEMKHYSQYVIKYLLELISLSSSTALSKEEYLLILDSVFSNKKIPNDLQKQLYQSHNKIKELLLKNPKDKYAGFVEIFLKKISLKNDKMFQDCLCDSLASVLTEDPSVLASWKKHYVKNTSSSAVLLKYIEKNFEKLRNSVSSSAFKDFLVYLEEANNDIVSKKRKEIGLQDAILSIKNIQDRLANKKPSNRGLISKFLRFIVITAFIAITLETIFKIKHGQYETSVVGKINSRLVAVASLAINRFKQEYPEYHEKITTVSEPYVELAEGFRKILLNLAGNVKESTTLYANKKYLQGIAYVDEQYPGLTTKIHQNYQIVLASVSRYFTESVKYIQKQLPVEKLSAENVQQIVTQATNITFQKVTECYDWVYHTIQRIAK